MAITLQKYLAARRISATNVEKLTGGTGNFIWRITNAQGLTSIIKLAPPFIATHREVPFDVERMGFEVKALQELPAILPTDPFISIPALLFHDDKANVIGLEDVGDKTLKDLYEDQRLDVKLLGKKLGTWLARLHSFTSEGEFKYGFRNETAKKMSAQSWLYEQLAGTLEKYGFDPALGNRIYQKYGTSLLNDEVCLCHGDLNPPNIMFRQEDLESGKATVIDWEMARIGNGATDTGQLAAEFYFLDRFRGDRGLLKAFLKAYVAERPLSRSDVVRVAVHFGTHIAFWPTIHVSDVRRGLDRKGH